MAAKIHSQREIYQVIEQHLREASKPLTVSELLDLPDMRAAAIAEYGNEVRVYTDRLSNALGLMWRREVVNRYPAPEQANSQARFAYEWPKDKPEKPVLPSIFPKAKTGVVVTEQDERKPRSSTAQPCVQQSNSVGHLQIQPVFCARHAQPRSTSRSLRHR